MKYTKAQKKLFVEQLKKARPLIANSSEAFVCHALESSWGYSAYHTKQMIRHRLDNHFTIGDWLEDNHLEFFKKTYQPQAYRLAWIDNMIEEFSK